MCNMLFGNIRTASDWLSEHSNEIDNQLEVWRSDSLEIFIGNLSITDVDEYEGWKFIGTVKELMGE